MAEVAVGGLDAATVSAMISAAIAGKADSSALSAVAATIPTAGTGSPVPIVDATSGAAGTAGQYAAFMHTHPSKARKAKASVNTATYTWTYPNAFDTGVVPIVSAIAQVSAGNTDLFNVQIVGTPTNTGCVFQINRVSAGLLSLLLGALSINPTPATVTLHMLALEP